MIKKFIITVIASLFIFVGCSTKNNEATEEKKQNKLSTSYKDNTITDKKIAFLGKSYSNSKYAFLGNLLFFPNPNNNDILSVSDIAEDATYIDTTSIIDNFNYNTNAIATDGNNIFFSSISTEKGLYKLDYQKKEITNLTPDSALEIVYYDNNLYYISSNDKYIYSYSIKDKEKKLLSSSKSSNLLINNHSIYYKNLSDNSKLYCLTTNNNNNFRIIDSSVDSFLIHNDEILFSNSNDNNYLYSLNPSTFESKKILDIGVSKLKQDDNKMYSINSEDPNFLYELILNNETNKFEAKEIFPHFTNDYYTSEKGLFIEAAHSLDNINILKYN